MKLLPIMRQVSGSTIHPHTCKYEVIGETTVDDDFYAYSISNKLRWVLGSSGNYVVRYEDNKCFRLHREVLERAGHIFQLGEYTDHLDRNTFNNQKYNLEVKSASGNARNSKLDKRSTTGIKGVCRDKHHEKYQAQIMYEGVYKYLGIFDTKEEAGYAYDDEVVRLTNSWKGTNQDLGLLPWRNNMTKQMKLNENGKLVAEKPTAEQVKLDKVTETYIKIRDARTALRKQYEAEDGELKAQLETLDGFLLTTLQDLGVESARTKHGTVYRSTDTKASCEDWSAFGDWIIENNAIEALERRVKKSFITTYMEDNKGELPPGINVLREYTVTIRRS